MKGKLRFVFSSEHNIAKVNTEPKGKEEVR